MYAKIECPECGPVIGDFSGGDGVYWYQCSECGEEWKTWSCRHCNAKFDERPPQYDCPECGPNNSRIYK